MTLLLALFVLLAPFGVLLGAIVVGGILLGGEGAKPKGLLGAGLSDKERNRLRKRNVPWKR